MELSKEKVWEQQEGESDDSFVHFLYYLNLGPTRSLEKAYHAYFYSSDFQPPNITALSKKVRKGRVILRTSGQFQREYKENLWEYRANQSDINNLSQVGRGMIANFYGGMIELSKQMLDIIRIRAVEPRNFEQLLEGMMLIGSFITPEALAAWQQLANSNPSEPTEPPGSNTGNVRPIRPSKSA